MPELKLLTTLWPSFPHFDRFSRDERLAGIRLNSAMISTAELETELAAIASHNGVPLWFDIKGRQLRVAEVIPNTKYLDIRLNHPIHVKTPTPVLFKAGADDAELDHLEEDGARLIFRGGPNFEVRAGESLHIRHPSLNTRGNLFTSAELVKIDKVKKAGLRRWFLSYVESARDVDVFRELVGYDAEVMLKIESKKGLEYVVRQFKKCDQLTLVAARGDLYVELDRPDQILEATKLIVTADPNACVGSRILLSVLEGPVPSCADFSELAWLYDIGYRTMMLCDELCLKEQLLGRAVNVFEGFRRSYATTKLTSALQPKPRPWSFFSRWLSS